jgi:hypothetical protein
MKADPCLNPACQSLNIRADGAPAPARCPTCGQDTLLRPPMPSDALDALARLARSGEDADWAYRAAVRAFAEVDDEEAGA